MIMKKNYFVILIIFFGFILTACQDSDQTQSIMGSSQQEQADQSDTEELHSSDLNNESGYDSNEDHSAKSEEDNIVSNEEDMDDKSGISENHSSNQETSLVKEKSYPNEKEAVNAIENFHEIEQTNLDLGHGIKGFSEGAAGHHYISWNEGNWLIEINFPTNPEYAIDKYVDGESMAKSIVNYLEDHFLPPPDQRGIIQINGFREHPETIIRWQQGNTVYEVDQKTADPIAVLQIAVDETNK